MIYGIPLAYPIMPAAATILALAGKFFDHSSMFLYRLTQY